MGTIHRRRLLQGISVTGIAGVLAGCLGGGDDGEENGTENGGENGEENGTENGGENGEGNDAENGNETAPASFEVSSLDLGSDTVIQGVNVEISATVENTGEEEGTQNVVLEFDGEELESVELTLDGGEDETVSLGEYDTSEFEPDDYEYAVNTDDDEVTATLTVEALETKALFAFDGSQDLLQTGSNAVTGSLGNSYPFDAQPVELTLSVPDGWEVSEVSGTSLDTLEAGSLEDVEWEIDVPDDTIGEFELGVEETHSVGDEEATFSHTLETTVNPPFVLDFNQAVQPSEVDPDVADDRPLAFFCSAIELLNDDDEQLILYNIGDEPEPPELEGVYAQEEQPEDEFEEPEDAYRRWFGTDEEQTTIFFDLEHIRDAARVRLRGEPMVDDEISATVSLGGEEITTVDFGPREMANYFVELDGDGGSDPDG